MSEKNEFNINMSEEDEKYNDVALVESLSEQSPYFVDNASKSAFFTSLAIFASVLVLLFFSTMSSFHASISEQDTYAVNNTEKDRAIDIDLNYSQLTDLHKYLHVKFAVRRKPGSTVSSVPIHYTANNLLMSKGTALRTPIQGDKRFASEFDSNNLSPFYDIYSGPISDADTYICHLGLETSFGELKEYVFEVSCSNPKCVSYTNSIKPLISLISAYLLFIFFIYSYEDRTFTNNFIYLLGFSGILYFNPFHYFNIPLNPVLDQLFVELFITLFHVFCIIQLNLIKNHNATPSTQIIIIAFLISAILGAADGVTDFKRYSQINEILRPVLPVEYVRIGIRLLFIIYITMQFVGITTTASNETRRMGIIFSFAFGTALISLLFELIAAFFNVRDTILDSVIAEAVEALTASFLIYFFHGYCGVEYKNQEDDKNEDDAQMMVETDDGPVVDLIDDDKEKA